MAKADERHPDNPCGGQGGCDGTEDRRQNKADVDASEFTERRQNVVDRRLGLDRRRGPGRRRSEERKAAEEGQMSDEQFEFVMAVDEYKRANARPFPTWTEVLDLIKALGYRRVADPQPLAESHSASNSGKPAKGGHRSRKPQLSR